MVVHLSLLEYAAGTGDGAAWRSSSIPSRHLPGGDLPPRTTMKPVPGFARPSTHYSPGLRGYPRGGRMTSLLLTPLVKGENSPKIEYCVFRKSEHTSKYLTLVAATYLIFKPLCRLDVFECTFRIWKGCARPFSPGEPGIHLDRR